MTLIERLINTYPELAILTLVIILERFLPLPNKYSISAPAMLIADSLKHKVLKSNQPYQTLYGVLSLMVYFFLFLTILYSLLFIAVDDVITQGVLLYVSINYHYTAATTKKVAELLRHNQKSAARTLLSSITNKDTNNLSELGLKKLNTEILALDFLHHWFIPLVLFIFLNAEASLLYRLLVEAQNSWPIYTKKSESFGVGANKLASLIQIPLSWVLSLILVALKNAQGWLNLYSQNKEKWTATGFNSSHLLLLSLTARGCKTELAGPFSFQNDKISRLRLEQGKDNPNAVSELLSWHQRLFLLFIVFNITLISILAITN